MFLVHAGEAYLVKHLTSNQESCEFESRLPHYFIVRQLAEARLLFRFSEDKRIGKQRPWNGRAGNTVASSSLVSSADLFAAIASYFGERYLMRIHDSDGVCADSFSMMGPAPDAGMATIWDQTHRSIPTIRVYCYGINGLSRCAAKQSVQLDDQQQFDVVIGQLVEFLDGKISLADLWSSGWLFAGAIMY